ncbi:hypothetical protein A2I97_19400 [Bacillus velezensis]|nr:hypothetical protein A2I97_19400 [Bacillus velezensis]
MDHELVMEYAKSEPIEQHIKSFYSALMAATGKGKSALPMYYDAKCKLKVILFIRMFVLSNYRG